MPSSVQPAPVAVYRATHLALARATSALYSWLPITPATLPEVSLAWYYTHGINKGGASGCRTASQHHRTSTAAVCKLRAVAFERRHHLQLQSPAPSSSNRASYPNSGAILLGVSKGLIPEQR